MRSRILAALLMFAAMACSSTTRDAVSLPMGLTQAERCQVLQDYFDRAEFNGETDEMRAIHEQMDREGCY